MRRALVGWVLLGSGCFDKNPEFIDTMTTGDGPGGPTADPPQTESNPTGSDPTVPEPTTTEPTTTTTTTGPNTTTSATMPPTTSDSPDTEGPAAVCGDGKLDPGEQCDDGDADDVDGCRNDCTLALCGDGFASTKLEACDDGNDKEDDDCLNNCKLATCGDGVTRTGVEECDDGNIMGDDGCDPDCRATRKLVFVSSKLFNGNMGGLLGADDACKAMAAAASLPGPKEFRAWLSTDVESPLTRMKYSEYPYVLVDETPVAMSWEDFMGGTLDHPIDLTEKMTKPPLTNDPGCEPTGVYTNTMPDGNNNFMADACFGWTSLRGQANWGLSSEANAKWTSACDAPCFSKAPIYCVQQ